MASPSMTATACSSVQAPSVRLPMAARSEMRLGEGGAGGLLGQQGEQPAGGRWQAGLVQFDSACISFPVQF